MLMSELADHHSSNIIIGNFSYNVSNAMSGQHCRSTLEQYSIYRLKQHFTNVDCWARRSSFDDHIGYFSYNDSNVVPGQHCSLTLAQHNVHRLKQYDVNVDCWTRRSSFVKYIGNISYNDLNDLLGRHCSSSLAQHYVYRLKTILYEWWLRSAPIIIRQIYRKLFLQWFECCTRSILQHNTSTALRLSFKTVSCECWLLSAHIIIRQIYRKLF